MLRTRFRPTFGIKSVHRFRAVQAFESQCFFSPSAPPQLQHPEGAAPATPTRTASARRNGQVEQREQRGDRPGPQRQQEGPLQPGDAQQPSSPGTGRPRGREGHDQAKPGGADLRERGPDGSAIPYGPAAPPFVRPHPGPDSRPLRPAPGRGAPGAAGEDRGDPRAAQGRAGQEGGDPDHPGQGEGQRRPDYRRGASSSRGRLPTCQRHQ